MADFNTGLNAEQLMKALNAVQTINNEEPDENHNVDINVAAVDINYDNTESGLQAENTQDAIDEAVAALMSVGSTLNTQVTDLKNEMDNYGMSGGKVNISDSNVSEICSNNADNLPNNRIYGVGLTSAEVSNFPELRGQIITLGKISTPSGSGDSQIFISSVGTKTYIRFKWNSQWSNWKRLDIDEFSVRGTELNISDSNVSEICSNDANNLPNNRIYGVGLTSANVSNFPELRGQILTFGKSTIRSASSDSQIFISKTGAIYLRLCWNNVWTGWVCFSKPLNILAVGDSICRGYRNGERGFVGDLGYPYVNASVSGATLSNVVTGFKNIPDQLEDYTSETIPDVIISNGGVNDYYHSAQLGSTPTVAVKNDTEANALDRSTIMGGLQYLFYMMIKKYPKAQRFFLLTHKTTARESNTSSTIVDWTITDNSAGYTQTELFEAIKDVCKLYGVKVIDVFGESIINTAYSCYKSATPYDTDHTVTDREFVDSDGIHPLAYGYKHAYAPLVKQALEIGTSKQP